ncbi:MAG: hypothetical protein LBU82_08230 [Treponema sp.]|jgi:hypothetical protein|nr:hypothetical protein [Treponema sp.]
MKARQDSKKGFLNYWEIIGYLNAQLAKRLKWQNDWDQPSLSVGIGLGCPRYHVNVSIHNLALDRQAAIILYELGIPDALATSGSYRNFDDDYLSISGESLKTFGEANREKILEWAEQRDSQKPEMKRLHEIVTSGGFGEKLDYLLAAAVPFKGGAL